MSIIIFLVFRLLSGRIYGEHSDAKTLFLKLLRKELDSTGSFCGKMMDTFVV